MEPFGSYSGQLWKKIITLSQYSGSVSGIAGNLKLAKIREGTIFWFITVGKSHDLKVDPFIRSPHPPNNEWKTFWHRVHCSPLINPMVTFSTGNTAHP
jgi:hypothetical protein